MEINDGSSLQNIQVIADDNLENYEEIKQLLTGSALAVTGSLVESGGRRQAWCDSHGCQIGRIHR